ncbi:MAG TPA: hypothetical protein PLJ21_04605 [Pseudobdellovibrionaceae bacterium]|nr:hypothetical protein [Pseudobdellovibrionaceae bacterium]
MKKIFATAVTILVLTSAFTCSKQAEEGAQEAAPAVTEAPAQEAAPAADMAAPAAETEAAPAAEGTAAPEATK